VTALVHGPAEADAADAATRVLFGGAVDEASAAALEAVAAEVPTVEVARDRLAAGVDVVGLLVDAGAAASKGEARRLLTQGGVRVNGEAAAEGLVVGAGHLRHDRFVLLRRGKSDYRMIVASRS
jgi:tyrosyl-tRNA synthetase